MDAILDSLVSEQLFFRLDQERASTLDRYSEDFGLTPSINDHENGRLRLRNTGLIDLIKQDVQKKGKLIWVDLGCGLAVPQRQARHNLELSGIDPGTLKTFGYDLYPPEDDDISRVIKEGVGNFYPVDPAVFLPKYSPSIMYGDVSDIRFKESPDMVTAHFLLFWTKDPLKVIANAFEQANIGSTLLFNSMMRLNLNHQGMSLKNKINEINKIDPSFRPLDQQIPDVLALVKIKDSDIFRRFSLIDRVERTKHYDWGTEHQGFSYYYKEL